MGCVCFTPWVEDVKSQHGNIKVPQGNLARNWKDLTPAEVKEVSFVRPGLYLGSVHAAADIANLQRLGITHILNLAGPSLYTRTNVLFDEKIKCPQATNLFKYKVKDIKDNMSQRVANIFAETSPFIKEGVSKGGCLVHCMMGVSRSTTFLIAYLIDSEGMTYEEAVQLVQAARKAAQPNTNLREQLKKYEKQIHGIRPPTKSAAPPAPPEQQQCNQQTLKIMAEGLDNVGQQQQQLGSGQQTVM